MTGQPCEERIFEKTDKQKRFRTLQGRNFFVYGPAQMKGAAKAGRRPCQQGIRLSPCLIAHRYSGQGRLSAKLTGTRHASRGGAFTPLPDLYKVISS